MTLAINGTSPIGTGSSGSSQIAALQKQLLSLQKQLTEVSKSGSSETTATQVELLSEQIAMVQAQIAQIQQTAAQNVPQVKTPETTVSATRAVHGATVGTNVDTYV